MKRSEKDRLLREILAGEELAEFRQASLDQALTSFRRQRRLQRIRRAGALVSLALLPALAIFLGVAAHSRAPRRAAADPPPAAIQPVRAETAEIKVITDEELFAMFPGRPLALTGKPGHQELVFLDQPRTTGQP